MSEEAEAYERGWAACQEANRIKLERLRHENDRLIDENDELRAEARRLVAVREVLTEWAEEARGDLGQLAHEIEAARAANGTVEANPVAVGPRAPWWKRARV